MDKHKTAHTFRMHTHTWKFHKSLTHALVMDIIQGLLMSIYYSLLLQIGVRSCSLNYNYSHRRQHEYNCYTSSCTQRRVNIHIQTCIHAQINRNYIALLLALLFSPQVNPFRAHHSGLFYIPFIAHLMSCFDNMSESHETNNVEDQKNTLVHTDVHMNCCTCAQAPAMTHTWMPAQSILGRFQGFRVPADLNVREGRGAKCTHIARSPATEQ